MDVTDALERIDTIHAHLAKGEEFGGYRPLGLGVSGLGGLLAAALQPVYAADEPTAFAWYWLACAAACALLAGGTTLVRHALHEGPFARRRTRTVLRQMVPSLLAGAVVTVVLARPEHAAAAVRFLPGLWALLYGLGAVASLPYLPRAAGCVAAWYLGWGGCLLLGAGGPVPSAWAVGVPFGCGQLLAAGALLGSRAEGVS
jgi:hypothetical protein